MKTAVLYSDEMLKTMVAEAVKQQTQIRSAIRDIMLKALQARELGLGQIKNVVRSVTKGVNAASRTRAMWKSSLPTPLPAWTMPCSRLSRQTRWHWRS
jgi:Family of unknown function (DUF6781)